MDAMKTASNENIGALTTELSAAMTEWKKATTTKIEAESNEKFETYKAQQVENKTTMEELTKTGYSQEQINILESQGYFEAEDKKEKLSEISKKFPTTLKVGDAKSEPTLSGKKKPASAAAKAKPAEAKAETKAEESQYELETAIEDMDLGV